MTEPSHRAGSDGPSTPAAQHVEEIEFRPASEARSGRRRLHLVLGSLGLVVVAALGLGLWFVFTARSVLIVIEPPPDAMQFDSTGLRFQLGDRLLVRQGPARVRATLEGYYPLDETVQVGDKSAQDFEFALEKKPGEVTFVFEPPVADPQIRVDKDQWTSVTGMLSAGRHDVHVESSRFQPLSSSFDVEGGGAKQTVALAMTPNWAEISFSSLPEGAEIVVDGTVRAQTPAMVEILAGDHQIALRARGYKAWRRPLQVVANVPQEFADIGLDKADGLLSVATSPTGASVSVNGRYRGQTPIELKLPPNQGYTIRVSKAGYGPVSRRVQIRSDEDQELSFALEVQMGELRFDLKPASAQVVIDGQVQTLDNGRLVLSAVAQNIEVRADGYVSQTRSVTPNPGYSQDVRVHLLTRAAAREAAIKKTLTTGAGQVLRLMRPRSFSMGASRRERGRRANEVLREIEGLPEFYIGDKEVTNKEFREFDPQHDSGSVYAVSLKGEELPVVNVGWQDAVKYCNWLSKKDGLEPVYVEDNGRYRVSDADGYRLPSEAEWSWAARFAGGQDGPRFPWGQELPPEADTGNYADRSAVGMTSRTLKTYNDGYAATSPVGHFEPTAAGLYDIGGNVSEWMEDEYTIGLSGLSDEGGSLYHVVRGSSWMHADISELRLTFRDFSDTKRPDIGFRIAKNLEEPEL